MRIIIAEKCLRCGGKGIEPSTEKYLPENSLPEKCHHCKGEGSISFEKEVLEVQIPLGGKLQHMSGKGYLIYWKPEDQLLL